MDTVCRCGEDREPRFDSFGELAGYFCPRCRIYEERSSEDRAAERAARIITATAHISPKLVQKLMPISMGDWHDQNYDTVLYGGRRHRLTRIQAAIVRALDKTPYKTLPRNAVLRVIRRARPRHAKQRDLDRVRDFFRGKNHCLWGALVVPLGAAPGGPWFKLSPWVSPSPYRAVRG